MIREYFRSLLPEYANRSLGSVKTQLLRVWLKFDTAARTELQNIQHLQDAINTQPLTTPSPMVIHRILDAIPTSTSYKARSGFWRAWVGGMSLIVLSAILLWNVLPPGITLQWSVQGGQPVTNRVYRADTSRGNGDFKLVYEIPAMPGTQIYTFKDFFLLPGKEYKYRVEVIDQSGLSSDSRTITSNSVEVLPGQLAMLVSLIITAYGISLVIKKPKIQILRLVL